MQRYRVEIRTRPEDDVLVWAELADGGGLSWDIRDRGGRHVAVDSYVEVIERLVGMADDLYRQS
jgi:hypothetical protein